MVLALHAGVWTWLHADTKPITVAMPLVGLPAHSAVATRSVHAPLAPTPTAPAALPPVKRGPTARPGQTTVAAPQVEAAPAHADDPSAAANPVPLYATRFAADRVLSYELRRGAEQGAATLFWQTSATGYEARLDSSLAGRPTQGLVSRGGFDAAGLAPERQVDERRGRAKAAINFRREDGLISFSASTLELPLPPGAQDRVSWIMQLSAIVAAQPERFTPGQAVLLPVASGQGRLEVWTFGVQAFEPLDLPVGRLTSGLHLQRLPEALYEPRIEIWLDPQRQYFPVRLRWSRTNGEPGLEMNLQKEPSEP